MSSHSSVNDDDDEAFAFFIEEIGAEIKEDAFQRMKRLSGCKLSQGKIETITAPAELIWALVDADSISQCNLCFLSKMLKSASQFKLAKQVDEYANRCGGNIGLKQGFDDNDIEYFKTPCCNIILPVGLKIGDKSSVHLAGVYSVFREQIAIIKSDDKMSAKEKLEQIRQIFNDFKVELSEIKMSIVKFIVKCRTMSSFRILKKGVQSGKLGKLLTPVLVTDKMKEMVNGEDIEISVNVDPKQFEDCERYFKEFESLEKLFSMGRKQRLVNHKVLESLGPHFTRLPSRMDIRSFREHVIFRSMKQLGADNRTLRQLERSKTRDVSALRHEVETKKAMINNLEAEKDVIIDQLKQVQQECDQKHITVLSEREIHVQKLENQLKMTNDLIANIPRTDPELATKYKRFKSAYTKKLEEVPDESKTKSMRQSDSEVQIMVGNVDVIGSTEPYGVVDKDIAASTEQTSASVKYTERDIDSSSEQQVHSQKIETHLDTKPGKGIKRSLDDEDIEFIGKKPSYGPTSSSRLTQKSAVWNEEEREYKAEGLKLTALPSDLLTTYKHATRVDLSKNRLATLPNTICNLRQLTVLLLEKNYLQSLPDNIGDLQQLYLLNVVHNRLTSLPDSMRNLHRLDFLFLSNNSLEDLPDSITDLDQLDYLHLNNNAIKCLSDRIGNLTELTKLFLDGNKLHTLPDSISQLRNLDILDVHSNLLESLPDKIGDMSSLLNLNLEDNLLTVLPKSITNLRNLRVFNVGSNSLENLPDCIGELQQLGELYLYDNQLESLPDSIGSLRKLTILKISKNILISIPNIGNLQRLEILMFHNNPIQSLPNGIGQLRRLHTVQFDAIGNVTAKSIHNNIDEVAKLLNILSKE